MAGFGSGRVALGAVLLATASVGAVTTAEAQTTITTLPSWNGSGNVFTFGEGYTPTYGQTFTAPAGEALNNFTFYLNDRLVGTSQAHTFRSYVYAWNGSRITGPALYESGVMMTDGVPNGFNPVFVNTGSVPLIGGQQYVAFFSTLGFSDGILDAGSWGLTTTSVYSDGSFVFSNGGSFSNLSANPWSSFSGRDLAFTMNFGAAGCAVGGGVDSCLIDSATNPLTAIDAGAGNDTLQLGGATNFAFALGGLGTTYTNFENLEKIDASTITLTGTGSVPGSLTNSQGILTLGPGAYLSAASIFNSAGATLNIGGGATLEGTGNTLTNSGVINIAANGVFIDAGVNNITTGAINNAGSWTGALTVGATGSVNNDGVWTYNGSAQSLVEGAVVNNGTMTLHSVNVTGAGASFENAGTLNLAPNLGTSLVQAGAYAENSGTLNGGFVQVQGAGSQLRNFGILNSSVIATNGGVVTNEFGASITGPEATIYAGGHLVNAGQIDGFVVNQDRLTSTGALNNGLNNYNSANVAGTVNGPIQNLDGLLTIIADTTSNGALTVSNGTVRVSTGAAWTGLTGIVNSSTATDGLLVTGSLSTAGTIENNAGAQVRVANGGVLTAGTVNNLAGGTIRVDQGGTLNDDLINSGVVSNAGAYNANVQNSGAGAVITNETTGVWTGNVAFNTTGATIINQGEWNGSANTNATLNNAGVWAGALTVGSAGTLTNDGTWTYGGANLSSITGAVFNNGSMTLEGIEVSGASGYFENSGTLTLGSSSYSNADLGADIVNSGIWSGDYLYVGLGSEVWNSGALNTRVEAGTGGVLSNQYGGTVGSQVYVNGGSVENAGQINAGVYVYSGLLTSSGALNNGLVNFGSANVLGTLNGAVEAYGGLLSIIGNTTSDQYLYTAGAGAVQVVAGASWTGLTSIDNSSTAIDGLLVSGTLTTAGDLSNYVGANVRVANGGVLTTANVYNYVGGTIRVDQGGTVNDDLFNNGVVSNAGAYNGNVQNSESTAVITNESTGVWTGNLVSNTLGATVNNAGLWTGSANTDATLNNSGDWTGALTVGSAGALTNDGVWTYSGSAQSDIFGAVFNNGIMTLASFNASGPSANVVNTGTLNLSPWMFALSYVSDGARLENQGDLTGNYVVGRDAGSMILNRGNMSTSVAVIDGSRFQNEYGASVTGPSFWVGVGSQLVNAGTIEGFFYNEGSTTSSGVLSNGLANRASANIAGALNGEIANGGLLTIIADTISDSGLFISGGTARVSSGATWSGLTLIHNRSTETDGLLISGTLTTAGAIENFIGARVRVANGGVLTAGDIYNYAGGTIRVDQGGTLNDDLINAGVVSNAGAYNANVFNSGAGAQITNESTGVWTGDLLSNVSSASVVNQGAWNGSATNAASLTNSGVWTGALTNTTGGIASNTGTWNGNATNAASLTNSGTFNGNLTNNTGGIASNTNAWNGNATNAASLTNSGVWTGALTNNTGGVTSNTNAWNGAATNAASLTNSGTWTGALTNQATGVATNSGAWNSSVSNAGQFTNASGGSVSGLLTNTGVVQNAGTLNGGTINTGSLTTNGVVNGTLTNAALVLAMGAVNGPVNNSAQFQLSGALTSTGGSFTNLGGGILLNTASNYTGLGAITNAANGQIVIGNGVANALISGASMSNSGALMMANNRVGDRLTLTGAYTGAGAATLTVDVNMASNGNLADRVTVGSSTGTTAVTLNNVGGSRIYFANPIQIVSGGNGQGFVLANNSANTAAMATNGMINYSAQALPGGGWGIASVLNGPLMGSVTSDSLAFLTAGGMGLKARPEELQAGDVEALQGAGQFWARVESGALETKSAVSSSDPLAATGPTSSDLDTDGYKLGGAVRVFASDGLDVDLGVAAGVVNGESRQKGSGTVTRFEMPTYGVYAVANFNNLQIDLQYDVLDLNVEASKTVSAQDLSGEGNVVRVGFSLPLTIDGGTMTPFIRGETMTVDMSDTVAPGGLGSLTFSDLDASLLQAGVRTRLAFTLGDWAVTPGVDVSIGKEEGDGSVLFSAAGGGPTARINTPRDSTFFDLELGSSFKFVPSGIEFHGKVASRSGQDASGLAATLGARMQF
jgi:hypothetical protein